MASYLTITFTTTVSVALPPGTARQDAVRLLHDHALVIELGPLLARYARVEDDDPGSERAQGSPPPPPGVDRYTITEKLAYLPWGLWDGELDVRAEFVDTADGSLDLDKLMCIDLCTEQGVPRYVASDYTGDYREL
ncbi:hypothetical protein UCRNP2_8762 [Neofusicoccum parvum UCRNP2]|uniref:DUF7053 domain-containing protein n=1 Tax=Botryosphaeria parva (strain UCR-NP2) TaxID=1287680 RepID=R1FZI8_BOTPV|nr:hypothetical protein UCRNP2_8762 [Neofusicoccum parvum UCRNP2]